MELLKRKTHKYVGTYQHLDEWDEIGETTELSRKIVCEDTSEIEHPITEEAHVLVDAPKGTLPSDIRSALMDSYTMSGCHHEWDCCGCRSYRATEAKRVTGRLWCVRISSSRNY